MTNLGSFWPGNSYAFGINNAGQIVGSADTSAGARAFLYDADLITNLGTLGGTNSYAFGINSLKQITGSSQNSRDAMQAFLWENGRLSNLNELVPVAFGWDLRDARGINDLGTIIGWGFINGAEHAFFYSNGRVTDIGMLQGAATSYALGLNNSNEVVGACSFRNASSRAFVWRNGSVQDLDDLLPIGSGWELREALGINDSGKIVGVGSFCGGGTSILAVSSFFN